MQFPRPGSALPFGRFAVFVGLGNGSAFIDAFQLKPMGFTGLKTGYYTIPQSSSESVNTFGVVINADDPRNANSDISYVMPCIWLSDISMAEKILRPWTAGFDSLEYSVDMRVPFAQSTNVYHPNIVDHHPELGDQPDFAAAYVLGGLYFEQLRKLGGTKRPPALWIAVSLFDLRKHYARETITIDKWSGGTNYPIVMTTIGREVAPDDGKPFPDSPPDTPLPTQAPFYSLTLPGSASLQTESFPDDPSFRHFAFRITREHFLTTIERIRIRMPDIYGEKGSAPMSTDPADWGLTYFNFDAEIFHRSTFPQPVPAAKSRALVVELKNLRLQQAARQRTVKGYFESLAPEPDGTMRARGWACVAGSEGRLRLSAVTPDGQVRDVGESIADRASEPGVQRACRITDASGVSAARTDGSGFRFMITLGREEVARLAREKISDLRVTAHTGTPGQEGVRISKVPNWTLQL